jgi:hypothetical protein
MDQSPNAFTAINDFRKITTTIVNRKRSVNQAGYLKSLADRDWPKPDNPHVPTI